jgi:hypothetical protein
MRAGGSVTVARYLGIRYLGIIDDFVMLNAITIASNARGDRAGQRCSAKSFHRESETPLRPPTANYLAVLTQILALPTTSRHLLAGNYLPFARMKLRLSDLQTIEMASIVAKIDF